MGKKEEMLTLKQEFIKDYFYLNSEKIAILENKAFKNVDENLLILAKVNENEKEIILEPLTDEEYEKAIKKYNLLVEVFAEDGDNE